MPFALSLLSFCRISRIDQPIDSLQTIHFNVQIIESLRINPRKRRKLNNHRAQASGHKEDQNSTTSDESTESEDEKSNHSNKENESNHNTSKPCKRSRPLPNARNRHQFQPNKAIHQFGDEHYQQPLNCQPGALVRLELVNFLCHSNFSISFHPVVNIIYGQNGSLVISFCTHSI